MWKCGNVTVMWREGGWGLKVMRTGRVGTISVIIGVINGSRGRRIRMIG